VNDVIQVKISLKGTILDISHLLYSIYIILAIFGTLIQASLRASKRACKSDGTALTSKEEGVQLVLRMSTDS
jgi:hypothetical protein